MNQTCPDCGVQHPADPAKQYKPTRKCEPCTRESARARAAGWRAANPDLARARTRQSMDRWRIKVGDDEHSVLKRLWRYNITREQYTGMLEAQQFSCAICTTAITERTAYVDHDHRCCGNSGSCGKCVRGLLCNGCNRALGFFHDDATRISNALAYLNATATA
jgi:hypothetical protein